MDLSRVDRVLHTIDPAKLSATGLTITGVTVAVLPVGSKPTGSTTWTALTSYTAPTTAKIRLAGPDADSSAALVVTADADLWALVTDGTQTEAVKIERLTVQGSSGSVPSPLPLPQVLSVNGKTGALSLTFSDVGADASGAATAAQAAAIAAIPSMSTIAADPALRAAFVAAGRSLAAWSGTTAYSQGDRVALPDGGLGVRRAAAGASSRATFDATENGDWDRVWFRFPFLEAVPALIIGDSYGQGGGSTDSDLGTTYFDRFCARHRTQTAVNRSVGGTRADQILMSQVVPNWTANTRGVVGIADVVINSVSAGVTAAEIAATFRATLAYLSARYIAGIADAGVLFGPGWTSGTTSTAGSYVDISFNGDVCYLLTTAVTTAGGSLTVKDSTGTTVATITTGGNAQTFTQATKLAGFGAGNHTVRVALASGTATVVGATIPSATPPLILWVKPGARGLGFDTQIAAALTACAAVLPDFPNVIAVGMDSFYNLSTMLGPSAHPNDLGNAYIANLIERAVMGATYFGQGLNRLSVASGAAASPYTPASPAYTSPGATAPAQVTGVTAATGNQVLVSWATVADGGASRTGYAIRYSLAGANTWTTLTPAPGPNVNSVQVTGLTGGSSYDFQVAEINAVGQGAWSATATATASTPVTTYASDSFNRADTTSTGPGSTEVGGFAWTVTAGDDYEILSNRLRNVTAGTSPADCYIDDAHSDGTLSLTLVNTGTVGGLVFRRAANGATGYVFYNSGSGYSLRKRTTNTAYTILQSAGTQAAAVAGDVLTVVLNGSSITCKVNGVTVCSATDATYTSTLHGAFTTTAGQSYDDFSHTSATS